MSTERLNTTELQSSIKLASGETAKSITLHKPGVHALRGVKLTDILQMDVDAVAKVLPRITEPALSETDVYRLEPSDFTDLAIKLTTFFVKREQLEGQALFLDQVEDAETL